MTKLMVINDKQVLDDIHWQSKPGKVVDGRIDRVFEDHHGRTQEIDCPAEITHIAVRISIKETQ